MSITLGVESLKRSNGACGRNGPGVARGVFGAGTLIMLRVESLEQVERKCCGRRRALYDVCGEAFVM